MRAIFTAGTTMSMTRQTPVIIKRAIELQKCYYSFCLNGISIGKGLFREIKAPLENQNEICSVVFFTDYCAR